MPGRRKLPEGGRLVVGGVRLPVEAAAYDPGATLPDEGEPVPPARATIDAELPDGRYVPVARVEGLGTDEVRVVGLDGERN